MKYLSLGVFMTALALSATCQQRQIPYANTIAITSNDSREAIIEKAVHVIPTANQYRALQKEFIAFIHFGPNTFTRMEWGSGKEDPRIFALENLDTDQWCRAMKSAGIKMVLLTVKHHDGFVLWQSRYTRHGIMSTGFRDGKGDILKDLSASCRKFGLRLGIYLSPADLYQIESPDGLYGNLSKYTMRTIPAKVSGRPFANKKTFTFKVDDYNEYFLNQLFEVLTEYGPVDEVWFDGAHPKTKGGQKYNYSAWKTLIKTLAPQAVIFGREDIRWCGNESGRTRATEWNVIPYTQNPDTASVFPDMEAEDIGSREKLYDARFLHYQQAETNTSIREGWFYRDDERQKVRSADDVFDIYERSVGGNSTFLLNIPPNRDGKFSEEDVKVLAEVGKRISETYATNLLRGASGPMELLDASPDTFLPVTKDIVFTAARPITLNRIVLQEAIAKRGERVEQHAVDAWINNGWQEIAHSTNIGYKRILRFPELTTTKLRLRIIASRAVPALSHFSAHYYKSRPPQLAISRDRDGMVTVQPFMPQFNWKPHGENSLKNLSSGASIYYTTDGSKPGEHSNKYSIPFAMGKGEVKAVAFMNGIAGPVASYVMGVVKKDWKVLAANDEQPVASAARAFDENVRTYWKSRPAAPKVISLDLGKITEFGGFAYTPQLDNSQGMMAKGEIYISNDNKSWTKAGDFEFGNLINDPTRRLYYFNNKVSARYVRIEATGITGNEDFVSIAEIDLI